ncbi:MULTISPECIES: hypothetical protein [unclassified Mesorhizobium]|uniref:hypothetical protein n=1 Tax=unclassified Mesorhizobium TaxID=325217 RepID=UPI000FD53944|nr:MULTISPECIES: hypothetical protein [unclassified Mesorhizobium]RVB71894.1 hypothetical protein EN885_31055 [Mesorhizobium sp. M6A.T.Cr.TU.014.01.1.1]RWP77260.1 MAG: hypothetical protein EOR10_16125 [Mesorhizobium sp.]RWP96896.1 MAG: hypothetical protein EOR90_29175 [Mesorhizobium sp.]RWP97891.1 MAG: hypothetical protein EOR91_29010 [Mesorhizobium sp.]RWQ66490.1 MAG: hypothetical protein EOS86_10955 [Mesorhizobium sp.]
MIHDNPVKRSLPKADFKRPSPICVDRILPALFALLTNIQARLSAIRAFAANGFQTLSVSVIFLDLTGIIAFDAVREWEAARRLRCGVPGMGRNGKLHSHRKKVRFA